MIDTHAHLDACADPADVLVERARAAGVDRIVTIGTGDRASQPALALGRPSTTACSPALGIDPHQAAGDEAERLDELRRLARASEGGRRRRDRPRQLPPLRLADAAAGAVRRPARAGRRAAQARRRPHARGRRGDGRGPGRVRRPVVLHCFSSPGPAAGRRSSAATTSRSRATSRIRRAPSCARPRPQYPPTASWPRPTVRTSRRSRVRGRPNEPANVVHTLAVARGRARRGPGRAGRADRRQRRARVLPAVTNGAASSRSASSASTSWSTRTSSA